MIRYDASIIRQYAAGLYNLATHIIFTFTLSGGVLGAILGYLVGKESGVLVCMLIGGFIGYNLGSQRAFSLKLQAQLALCLVQIEENSQPLNESLQQLVQTKGLLPLSTPEINNQAINNLDSQPNSRQANSPVRPPDPIQGPLVQIASSLNPMDSYLLRNQLEAAGIASTVSGFNEPDGIKVSVAEINREKALQISQMDRLQAMKTQNRK